MKRLFAYIRPGRATAFGLLLLFSLLFLGQSVPAQDANALPYQWGRSHDYDVQHYRIKLSFDWDKRSVAGEVTMTFRPFKTGLQEVEIDAGDMTIHSVKLASGTPLKFRYEDKEKLYVTLDQSYPAGRDIALTIAYTAIPTKGLTFITPTPAEPNQPYQIWSDGQPERNHYWLPCYDYPNDFATSELIATVADRFRVLSNGKLSGVQAASAGYKTWHWKMDEPFSSYLISVVVGEFAEVVDRYKDTPVVSYVYPDQLEQARLSLSNTASMVAFFSQVIGTDYPFSKYAQATVRDYPGGLENTTATILMDTVVHDRRAHLDVSSDSLVAHELAHQWFGGLLICHDWGELWLNEGFATFFENLWAEHNKGKDDSLYGMLNNHEKYFAAWSRGNHRPMVINRYWDPGTLFDAHVYQRGGAVLNMLRMVLGDEAFFNAIRHYVKKYRAQNVKTAQLITAIEESTGQNLAWFFDEWVYKMGHPEFEITANYDEAAKSLKLTVKQTQKADANSLFPSAAVYVMPVDVAITTASGEKVHRLWIDKADQEFSIATDSKPLIINFDRGNYLIKKVKFDRTAEEIAYQMVNDRDVMGRLRAAIELRAKPAPAKLEALRYAALHDRFWGVRLEAVRTLAALKTDAKAVLLEALNDSDSRIRRAAIQGLSPFKDPKLAPLYAKLIATDPSYYVVVDACRALGNTGVPEGFAVLVELLKQDSWQEVIRGGALDGLTALKNPRALEFAFQYSGPAVAVNPRKAALRMLGELGKGNNRARAVLTESLTSPSQDILFAALQGLISLGDVQSIPALEAFANLPGHAPFVKPFVSDVIKRIREANRRSTQEN